MRTYKLYYTGNTTINQAAYVTVQKTGRIRSARWAVALDSITDGARLSAELSIVSTIQNTTNDALGPIDMVEWYGNFVTSGLNTGAVNVQRQLDFAVVAGERINLNLAFTGTLTAFVTVFIDVAD